MIASIVKEVHPDHEPGSRGPLPHLHLRLFGSGLRVRVARDAIPALLPHLVVHPTPHEISLEKSQSDLLSLVWLVSNVDQRCDKWFGHYQLVTIVDKQPPPRALLLALLLDDAEAVPPLFKMVNRVGMAGVDHLGF